MTFTLLLLHFAIDKCPVRYYNYMAVQKHSISMCGAVGSAGGLGACPAVIAEKIRKSRKAFNGADFRHFMKTQNSVEFAFDHSLSHFHAENQKIE